MPSYGLEPSVFSSAVQNVKIRIYETGILPVLLYGYETWSLIRVLREVHRLKVFENRVPRRRDEVTGGWRNLHIEELCDLYSSPSIITLMKLRRMRWVIHVAQMGRRGSRIGHR
jgi:hypothetical protein